MMNNRRLALDATHLLCLRRADSREVKRSEESEAVIGFLIQQHLIRLRERRGEEYLEVSAEGRIALLRYGD